jgi:hypothetical protein
MVQAIHVNIYFSSSYIFPLLFFLFSFFFSNIGYLYVWLAYLLKMSDKK